MSEASVKVLGYLVSLVWASGTFFTAALVSRLFALDLDSRYSALVRVLSFQLARSLVLLCLRPPTNAYAWIYLVTEPIVLLLYVFVILEIYQQVFESYRGLSVLGRRSLWTALACSMAVSLVSHRSEFDFSNEPIRRLRSLLLLETTVCSTLLVFLVIVVAFLAWYPVPVRRNLLVYAFGFSLFFASLSVSDFLRNLDPVKNTKLGNLVRLGGTTGCLIGWLALFRRKWEEVPERVMVPQGAITSQLLAQLEAMNKVLTTGKKPTQYTV